MTSPSPERSPWPTEIRVLADGRALNIVFESGEAFELAASDLRRRSPSAEGRGHGPAAPPRPSEPYVQARIVGMAPVGRYAVRIDFEDGHDTGLYTWALLLEIGRTSARPE